MQKYQKGVIVAVLMLAFTILFLHNTKSDFGLIFKKDLLAHDESSNSVVAANITRKFFPPMVRVNPLIETQGNWMEGPFWQHIPPLFAYVPYVFFKLDGQITIEVKRLSYALITLLTGLLFIFGVYKFRKNLAAAVAATIAAIFWINTPFTHELITGYAFGVSDIVLAFTVVGGFCAVLWHMREEREGRKEYPVWKLALMGLIVALPITAKNLLGAIPAATFFGLLLLDHREINKKILAPIASFAGLLLIYLLPLYFSSPQTFKTEILVSFFHAQNYEGWGRAWHWYVTNYLPQDYLGRWTWAFYIVLILGIGFVIKDLRLKFFDRKDKVLLWLSGGWFVWNLVAISLIKSKIPNFIYQSYLLSLFFVVYSVVVYFRKIVVKDFSLPQSWTPKAIRYGLTLVLVFSIFVTGYEVVRFTRQFKVQRAQAYDYQSEHEKFYQTAEELRNLGLNTNDIIIVRIDDSDCWFRYYPLFLTGTESKTLLEMSFGFDANAIKQKYSKMYFVVNKNDKPVKSLGQVSELTNYSLVEFDLSQLSATQIQNIIQGFISVHQQDISQDIVRIKADKTSCQWLVPDPILNAP